MTQYKYDPWLPLPITENWTLNDLKDLQKIQWSSVIHCTNMSYIVRNVPNQEAFIDGRSRRYICAASRIILAASADDQEPLETNQVKHLKKAVEFGSQRIDKDNAYPSQRVA
jgi:hypothetical protein